MPSLRNEAGASSFVAVFVVALGYGVLVPLAPSLVQRAMGSIPQEVASFHTGALSAVYLLAFAVIAPFWGRAVDTFSRRLIATGGLAGFTLSFVVMSLSAGMELMYAALATAGAFAAAVVPAVQSQVGRVEGDAAKARLLSALGAASFAGWFLGPPLASWSLTRPDLGDMYSATIALAVVAASGIAATLLTALTGRVDRQEHVTGVSEANPDSRSRRAWRFGLLSMAVTFGIGGFEVSLVLWAVQVMRLEAGVLSRMLVECTVVMMIVQATIFFLPAARPRWNPLAAGAAFSAMAVAVALIPLTPAAWAVFGAVAVVAASATLLQAMLSFGTVASAGNHIGAALGLQLSLSSLGQGLGSLSAGTLFSPSGNSFFASAVILLAAGVVASLRSRMP